MERRDSAYFLSRFRIARFYTFTTDDAQTRRELALLLPLPPTHNPE